MTAAGAPQPSTPVWATGSPQYSAITASTSRCSGCAGSRYVATSCPDAAQAARKPACLPEQLKASGVAAAASPSRRTWATTSEVSAGQAGGHCRADASRPASASMRSASAWCRSVPRCEPHAMDRASPASAAPWRSDAMAWNGFSVERG